MRVLRALALCLLVGFGSCAQLSGSAPTVDDSVLIAAVKECNAPLNSTPVAANDYMQVGFAKVFAACEVFFVAATRVQENANSANNTLTAGLAGATAILPLVEPSAAAVKAIAITGAGVLFGQTIINAYTNNYTFAGHLYKVRQLVYQEMAGYVTSVQNQGLPADTCIAYSNVQRLAQMCTIANMQALLDQQIALPSGAPVNTPNTPPPAAAGLVGAAPKASAVTRLPSAPPGGGSQSVSYFSVPAGQATVVPAASH
jgi:hypothetical protein